MVTDHCQGREAIRIDPASVAFDIDGVIADTMTLFLDIARQDYGVSNLRYDDMTAYALADCLDMDPALIGVILERIMAGDYTAPLASIGGAETVLPRVAEHRNPLLFVTARPHPGPMGDWLCDALRLPAAAIKVIATGTFEGKTDVLRENGIRFFVEDRLETCYRLKDDGIEPVLYRQPWNRAPHPFTEVGSWRELEALMNF